MTALIPCVWTCACTSRSPAAFVAEYGEEGRSGESSVNEPCSIEPYTSSVDTWR